MYGRYEPPPASPLAGARKPGTPGWVEALTELRITRRTAPAQFASAGLFLVAESVALAAFIAGGAAGVLLGLILATLPVIVLVGVVVKYRNDYLLAGPSGRVRYGGIDIEGEALTMLEDIQTRFSYAERLVNELPTGISWADVDEDARTIVWDAASHAARVSQLDVELRDMAYAEAGTPQAVLKRRLEERRAEHWQVLLGHQREADSLARVAGNAAAAAKVALARTGSIYALEVAAPSTRAIVARGALAEARARLLLLADVWAELDETTDLTAERLGINPPPQ